MRMRVTDHQQSGMFIYISAERRVAPDHPLRAIRAMVDVALRKMGRQFEAMYAKVGRRSIPPEKLLRALLAAGAVYRAQRAHADGATGLQSAVSLVRGAEHRRSGVGCNRLHQESRAALAPQLPRASLPRCWRRPAAAACSRPSTSRSTAR